MPANNKSDTHQKDFNLLPWLLGSFLLGIAVGFVPHSLIDGLTPLSANIIWLPLIVPIAPFLIATIVQARKSASKPNPSFVSIAIIGQIVLYVCGNLLTYAGMLVWFFFTLLSFR